MTRKKDEPIVFQEVEIPDIFAGLDTSSRKRRSEDTPLKSVAFGACPLCSNFRLGLVPQGQHLAWREHTYQTHAGTSMTCQATGQRLCELPARDYGEVPTCPCQR